MTAPFEEISLQELAKCLQKFYLSAARLMRVKIVIAGNCKWVKNHHFVLTYITVLAYTKLIIHLTVGC